MSGGVDAGVVAVARRKQGGRSEVETGAVRSQASARHHVVVNSLPPDRHVNMASAV